MDYPDANSVAEEVARWIQSADPGDSLLPLMRGVLKEIVTLDHKVGSREQKIKSCKQQINEWSDKYHRLKKTMIWETSLPEYMSGHMLGRAITGGLRHMINDHGPITKPLIGSASRRIREQINARRIQEMRNQE